MIVERIESNGVDENNKGEMEQLDMKIKAAEDDIKKANADIQKLDADQP